MDYMDIDQVCDVPDTPDRLPVQNIDGRVCIEKESDSSVVSHSGNTNFLDGGARNRLRGKSRLVTDGGHSRRLTFRHGKNLSSSNKSESDSDFTVQLGSSSKNAHLFRRMVADKTANHENKYSLQRTEKGKTPCTSQSSTHRENGLVDLTEQSEPAQVFQKAFPNRASEVQHAKEIREGLTLTNGFSSLHSMANPSILGRNTYKGKEKMDDTCKGVSGLGRGKGIFGDPQPKAAKNIPVSFHSISSPRVSGQKRLVRNGCISPYNIAKAKQSSGDHGNGPMDFQNDKETPVSDCSSSLIRDLIAEDNNSHRGQGVISHLFSSKQPDSRTTSTRCSITHNEEASEISNASGDAFKCFEGLGGWRSTRNRTKKINLPLSDEVQHLSRTKGDQFVSQQTENRVERSDNENGRINRVDNDYLEDQNAVSFQHGSASNVSQAVSYPIPHLDHGSGSRIAASTLKRQKQGFASSNRGESSTSSSVDSEVVFLGSSGEPSNSRSNRNQNGRGPCILDPVIDIDEFSPEIRHAAPCNVDRSSNDDSDARAIQVQVDEMLARELQEQLYNESPRVGDGEIDAHIALALQQEGTSHHAFSSGTHPVFHPRGSILSNFHRQSQSRSSQNPSIRRGTQARGPVVSSRFTRLRSRLPNQSPRIRYRERNSVFPANMDLDMRIHILEALEAFSDMGMSSNFLQVDREFTEDDYEMLLALDENNHQHGGASLDQINGLPQSTVQGDNFEEACAICLETPSSGDTIRHLPCLHKFHKECIDPWLRRKTSCPVCKSSVT